MKVHGIRKFREKALARSRPGESIQSATGRIHPAGDGRMHEEQMLPR
jgi:hypothetical protein